MKIFQLIKKKPFIYFSIAALAFTQVVKLVDARFEEWQKVEEIRAKEKFKATLGSLAFQQNEWPETVSLDGKELQVDYTFDKGLNDYIKKLLKRYRSDHSAVIVIDNATGAVLAAVGHQRKGNQYSLSLPFSSTHPGASLFKIVTSASLIDHAGLDIDRKFQYTGRGTTLYKYQLREPTGRWRRSQTFAKAFAYSNNVVFGKAAIQELSPEAIFRTATDMGFNKRLVKDLPVSPSQFLMPEDDYNLAEFASGFNRKTLISPVHAAVLSSIVSNNGLLHYPYVIREVKDGEGQLFFESRPEHKRVVERPVAEKLSELMNLTVKIGTARGEFRRFPRKLKKLLEVGAKTGTISGGVPDGQRDWFTAFARPKDSSLGRGISVGVMNVNYEKWYVKSGHLAKKIIEYYFREISPITRGIGQAKKAKNAGV